ncbi:cation-transporting P-type ATPase [Myceligenerans xiligouense]|uniref:Probable cation-transporting ATPase F n=1 Tax=Myceligenerans xiligouense TaxID=253184 RepID=A0A3N4YPR4_9MICO|nr:cation-transporting P-type ATPase [Myceligenerans xiligouense]RPF21354.1 cation-transporting ATPase F [Myceligenerans xiligouense]
MTVSVSVTAHHGLAAHEVVLLLETDPHHGLTGPQVAERLGRFGPNALPVSRGAGVVTRILRQFHHPLIYVLLAAGGITAGLGEYVDSAVIFGVVVVNALVGFIQESKAEAALEGLRSMVRTHAKVVRDGHERTVPSEDLVPGDLVLLEAGDKVPADLRLTRVVQLRVDESALTGESVPLSKDEAALPEAIPVADRLNMAYSGTLVTGGSGAGVVVATGAETELGEIHRLVGAAETLATPLTEKLARFSKILTVGILALAAATFGVGLLRGQDAVETFTAAIALAVGAIPEGLPAAVTITLAIGVARMARRRAVIRRLPAVETLGSTTVICSDKTGTLTENQMTVRTVWTPGERFEVSGSGYVPDGTLHDSQDRTPALDSHPALRWTLLAGAACNDAAVTEHDGRWDVVGDPTEGALLVAAAKAGLPAGRVARVLPRLAAVPFSSERQYMVTLHRDEAAGAPAAGTPAAQVVLAKGAVERILGLCDGQMDAAGDITPLDPTAVLRAADDLAGQGLRVLATAVRPAGAPDEFPPDGFGEDTVSGGMVLTGLQAMLDPPRAAAGAAVAACRTAGIAVKMITGDHAATATAIARRVGLLDGREDREGVVLTGADLAALPAAEFSEAVDRAQVFARVSPEQKLRLVEALQGRGHVVAMTGDGVNDAPALRQAGIGVAIGGSGTEVAKDAADMVLTDDDFATIEAAVEEGRGVFDNLTKFIAWTLPTNIGEGLVILVAIAVGTALPILPTQILWINMTTAVALGLMLAFEPKEPGIMTRPPRDPGQPLLTRGLMVRILLVSTLLVGGSWWLFQWELANGADLAEARTAALNLFVVVEAFYLFSCRSLTRSAWRIGLFSNRWILVGVTVQAVGQAALTYLPAMNTIFGTAPLGPDVWLRILLVAVAASLVVAADKRLRRGSV